MTKESVMKPAAVRQRAEFTYKANKNAGRHGWLRLTPAYSLNLVRSQLAELKPGSRVLEPFSGSGTTPLVSQELGLSCQAREINPFLVWFGNVKLDTYSADDVADTRRAAEAVRASSLDSFGSTDSFWVPDLFNIERWWSASKLAALSAIKHFIAGFSGKVRNLLDVSFCRTMIAASNAAFNHQSMSFKDQESTDDGSDFHLYEAVVSSFCNEVMVVIGSILSQELPRRTSEVFEGNSTDPFDGFEMADMVITSPPYANRMSYIRELRPYMYWMGYLSSGSQAGDLDWQTTGGTWGSASTKLKSWHQEVATPIDEELEDACSKILAGKSGEILSPYVKKYFVDMWVHFQAITKKVNDGGRLCYIVGNSTFSGTEVPTQQWYADMLSAIGYHDVHCDVIRKRNSNKKLFEYAVWATK